MTSKSFHRHPNDLPREIAVFPLAGALLLPGGRLPLNVFEPRYLALVEDALGQGRLFGMIQPKAEDELYSIGCLGRISSFAETEDGRLVITLSGITRFKVIEEVSKHLAYRSMRVDYSDFVADMQPPSLPVIDRRRLLSALSTFLNAAEMPLNVRVLDDLKDIDLINTLAMICPFEPAEKQALLEQDGGQARADTLLAILELSALGSFDDAVRQ